jgi:DNA ligase-1
VSFPFASLAQASAEIAETRSRTAKVERLAAVLREGSPEEVRVAVSYLSGVLPQGSIGVGWASLRDQPSPAAERNLSLLDVHAALDRIASLGGAGSQTARRAELHALFSRATQDEQRFLRGLLTGEIRQGALEGIMVEAVARAADLPASSIRRAAMLGGDLGAVAAAALGERHVGLDRFRLQVLSPVQPMLAQTADGIDEALARISPASVESKLDGARLQVHRLSDEVRAFTRTLADVTDRVPEIVSAIAWLDVDALILDGEAIALREDGRPQPFQVSMSRFGSRVKVDDQRARTPLSYFAFDLLHLDGEDLLDLPQSKRFTALLSTVPEDLRVARIVATGRLEAERFLEDALARGHEGVMVKALEAPYEAGRRGAGWLKVKRANTLDLVVLAAEWGHGRRQGWLSNLHLGARDPDSGGFVMLGKTFKGMTDEMLRWQTERLLELEKGREGIVVHVRPDLVVEVAFDGLQTSSRYPGGVALRFARIKGYRPDKRPEDADTIGTVLALAGR